MPSLEWTGEALYDVANARIRPAPTQRRATEGRGPTLRDLFDESITERRLIDALRGLRVPRHLFKFMYRLLVAHCNAHTDEDPVWRISGADVRIDARALSPRPGRLRPRCGSGVRGRCPRLSAVGKRL